MCLLKFNICQKSSLLLSTSVISSRPMPCSCGDVTGLENSDFCLVYLSSFTWSCLHRSVQHTRLPCPSLSPRVCSNSCLLSQWCHPSISSSVAPFSSCHQSFPASGSFPTIPLFTSGGQKYWSFSFSISPYNEHSGLISFRMDWLDFLAVQGSLKSSPPPQFKSLNSSVFSFLHSPTLTSIHDHWKKP